MRITFTVTEGPHTGKVFTFRGHETFMVGRSSKAHLRLPADDAYISRVHFLVEINPPHCRLLDMGSRNHTYVNNEIVDVVDLKDGDEIRAGHTVFKTRLEMDESVPDSTTPAPPPPPLSRPSLPTTPAIPVPPPRPSASTIGERMPDSLGAISATGMTADGPRAGPIFEGGRPPASPLAGLPRPSSSAATAAYPHTVPQPPMQAPSEMPIVSTPVLSQPSIPSSGPCLVCKAPRSTVSAFPDVNPIDGLMCERCRSDVASLEQTIPGYRLVRELGRGGMGIVYLAVREKNGKLVALKTVTPAVESSETELQKFIREASILRELDHPNIVKFTEMNTANGKLWFAMDYVEGTDAAKLLKQEGPLEPSRACSLVCDMLEALAYAHEKKFVHRDVKPGNLLVTKRDGREVGILADFGLARVYQGSQLSGLTITGSLGGTPMFMAPEQITQYRDSQPSVDQYAAAMTLYNLLTNKYGFEKPEHFRKWFTMILEQEPIPIRQRRPELPPALAEVVHKALLKDPAKRFPNVKAMADALRPFIKQG